MSATVSAAPPPRAARTRRRGPGAVAPAAAAVVALAALFVAGESGVHKSGLDGLTATLWALARTGGAAALLFGLCGYGAVRLALPEALRRHEWLWVLPVGACVSGLTLAALGYAYVPFEIALALTLAGGVALTAFSVRRRGPLPRPGANLAWPAYLALVLVCVALVPFFLAGFPTVIGTGSDSHLAAGTAEFLRHSHPTAIDASGPVDRVPLTWRSKPPIYYVLGGVATLSGLETWEALAPLAALLLAFAAVGFFVLARDLLGAGVGAAAVALGVVGVDRMVLHTVMVPYFNQTWGFFTLPFALVLSWFAVRERSRGAWILLALFLTLGAFAYPLALPIPVAGLAVFVAVDLRERRRRGEPVGQRLFRSLFRGKRALLAIPLALLLVIPALGVAEKVWTAGKVVLDPSASLKPWGGDVIAFFPANQFFALPANFLWFVPVAGMLVLAGVALRRVPRGLALGLAAVIVLFLAAGALFRLREFGYYFEFKTLAFVAPLVLACACAGASRFRRAGPVLLAALAVSAGLSGRQEVRLTGHQIREDMFELRDWASDLPAGASVRLDIPPPEQLWGAYMLSDRRVCSQTPLLRTQYPHVPFSRKADYVLTTLTVERVLGGRRPPGAVGRPLRENAEFRLYRADPGLPGPDRCSQRMVDQVTKVL